MAINSALDSLKSYGKATLFKEVVHNAAVNKMLESKGVKIKNNLSDLSSEDFVILRAHGETPATYKYLNEHNIKFKDCSCVNVQKIHECVANFSKTHTIILVGKYGKFSGKMHPEIEGTIGWCAHPPVLIEDEADLDKLKAIKHKKLYLIFQTTFNSDLADKLIEQISKIAEQNSCSLEINKSICLAQREINKSSRTLASNCDLMIVIGSNHSSNSVELYKALQPITKTIFFEDVSTWRSELKKHGVVLNKNIKIGITAGASVMKEELEMLAKQIRAEINKL